MTGDDLEILVKQCPQLYKIKLEDNLIDNLDKLKSLSGYNLKKINIKGNPVVEQNPDYKKELFDLIPSLEVIDETNKEGGLVDSTIYGDEEEEEEDDFVAAENGEDEDDDVSGEDFEGEDEGEEDDDGDEGDEEDDEQQKPKKKPKH